MRRKILIILFSSLVLIQAAAGPAFALQVHEIAGEFICNCECNKLLSACEMKCGDELRGFIKDKIRQGLGKEQIIQYMKVNFREAILAAPEKKGFNLTAWITPFAAVFAGAVLVYKMLGGWAITRQEHEEEEKTEDKKGPKVSRKYSERVEDELKDFGW